MRNHCGKVCLRFKRGFHCLYKAIQPAKAFEFLFVTNACGIERVAQHI